MSLAHGYQSFQVVEGFPMDGFAGPVDGIDGVRTVVGIAYTFLVAHNFVTREDERNTLRSEYGRMCQFVVGGQLFVCSLRYGNLQAVGDAMVVMTTGIAQHLCRLGGPGCRCMQGGVLQLRMRQCGSDTEHHLCIVSRTTDDEGTFQVVVPASPQSVTEFVTERGNSRHPVGVGFHGQAVSRISRTAGCPSFSVDVDGRVNLVQCASDGFHGRDVVDSHQVETETVDMVFVGPVAD